MRRSAAVQIQMAYNEEHGITPKTIREICPGSDQYFQKGCEGGDAAEERSGIHE